jgi:F0F1-type ATP synthase membrane subunit b/b'
MKHTTLAVMVAALTLATTAAFAAPPAQNVSGEKHPNIAAAQHLTDKAYQKIVAAQQANEWDMDGHAAKAKELLDQANNELKQAAEAANRHG